MIRKTTTALLKVGLVTLTLSCFALGQESTGSEVPSLPSIIQGMEKAQSQVRPLAPYQVIREYRLSGANSANASSDVVAEVDFRPPGSKKYNIQRSSGSSRGEQVVRRILDHEVEAATKSDQPQPP